MGSCCCKCCRKDDAPKTEEEGSDQQGQAGVVVVQAAAQAAAQGALAGGRNGRSGSRQALLSSSDDDGGANAHNGSEQDYENWLRKQHEKGRRLMQKCNDLMVDSSGTISCESTLTPEEITEREQLYKARLENHYTELAKKHLPEEYHAYKMGLPGKKAEEKPLTRDNPMWFDREAEERFEKEMDNHFRQNPILVPFGVASNSNKTVDAEDTLEYEVVAAVPSSQDKHENANGHLGNEEPGSHAQKPSGSDNPANPPQPPKQPESNADVPVDTNDVTEQESVKDDEEEDADDNEDKDEESSNEEEDEEEDSNLGTPKIPRRKAGKNSGEEE